MYYTKFIKIFHLFSNFEFFQNFSVKSQIFFHIYIVPIMYEWGEVKKVQGNKILYRSILEQCAKWGSVPILKTKKTHFIPVNPGQDCKEIWLQIHSLLLHMHSHGPIFTRMTSCKPKLQWGEMFKWAFLSMLMCMNKWFDRTVFSFYEYGISSYSYRGNYSFFNSSTEETTVFPRIVSALE